MRKDNSFQSNSSGQTIILTGFVIAVIIVGMGTILHSTAISGTQTSPQVSESTFNYFENVREEYGSALMVASDEGKTNPFNRTTTLLQFENKMKKIVESHGFMLNVTWGNYSEINKWASVTILFADGNRLFNDTVTYNLVNGDIVYDNIPPGRIMDLFAVKYPYCDGEKGAVILNFTAVGDDGYEDGTSAYYYDVRFSDKEITNNTEFYDADSRIGYRASENGTQESIIVPLPGPGVWYFSVKAIDEAGNPSTDVSNNTGFHFAVASNFSPTIQDVIFNNSEIYGDEIKEFDFGSTLNLKFNVSDLDNDTINVTLIVRNDTSVWYEETNWTVIDSKNTSSLNYSFTNIMENFSFYLSASDGKCNAGCSAPYNAPESSYYVNISDANIVTVALNWTYVNDTYIDSETDSVNYGDVSTINILDKTAQSEYKHGLIRFNLTQAELGGILPNGVSIISANISLYVKARDNPNPDAVFYRINESWDELGVNWTWFNAQKYISPATTSGQITDQGKYLNWSVGPDVNYFYNNPDNMNFGWLIMASNKEAEFYSKDETDKLRTPILYITFVQ